MDWKMDEEKEPDQIPHVNLATGASSSRKIKTEAEGACGSSLIDLTLTEDELSNDVKPGSFYNDPYVHKKNRPPNPWSKLGRRHIPFTKEEYEEVAIREKMRDCQLLKSTPAVFELPQVVDNNNNKEEEGKGWSSGGGGTLEQRSDDGGPPEQQPVGNRRKTSQVPRAEFVDLAEEENLQKGKALIDKMSPGLVEECDMIHNYFFPTMGSLSSNTGTSWLVKFYNNAIGRLVLNQIFLRVDRLLLMRFPEASTSSDNQAVDAKKDDDKPKPSSEEKPKKDGFLKNDEDVNKQDDGVDKQNEKETDTHSDSSSDLSDFDASEVFPENLMEIIKGRGQKRKQTAEPTAEKKDPPKKMRTSKDADDDKAKGN